MVDVVFRLSASFADNFIFPAQIEKEQLFLVEFFS
jgi:hypothetical protein